jgi:hypothetical protein
MTLLTTEQASKRSFPAGLSSWKPIFLTVSGVMSRGPRPFCLNRCSILQSRKIDNGITRAEQTGCSVDSKIEFLIL